MFFIINRQLLYKIADLFLKRKVPRTTRLSGGFTLTELLVTIIIGGLIITSITAIMTDIVRASKEEEVRNNTQRDMKKALDFIAADLEEAVYIYTGDRIRNNQGSVKSLTSHFNVNSNYEIVLAFWKPELIPYTNGGPEIPLNCIDSSGNKNTKLDSEITIEECENLLTERRTYTLVVYVQDTVPSDTWSGKSVIRRYQLRKYENETFTVDGTDYLTLNISENSSGNNIYVDPVKEADGFGKWPYEGSKDLQAAKPTINGNTSKALVDFVDNPQDDPGNLNCLDEDTNDDGDLDSGEDTNNNGVLDVYSRSPSVSQSKSFFVCVRQADMQGDFSQGNQDVLVYLRGNPSGRSGLTFKDNFTPLPTLQTQVMLRGVVDKEINQ